MNEWTDGWMDELTPGLETVWLLFTEDADGHPLDCVGGSESGSTRWAAAKRGVGSTWKKSVLLVCVNGGRCEQIAPRIMYRT